MTQYVSIEIRANLVGFDSQVDDDEMGWDGKQDDPATANLR